MTNVEQQEAFDRKEILDIMNRRRQRPRRDTVTRTYPIYAVSASELSDDDEESIIEIKPIKRHRKHPSRVKPQESIHQYVRNDYRKPPLSKAVRERRQKSAIIQTDEIPTVSSTVKKNEQSSEEKSTTTSRQRCLRIFALILAVFLLIISILLLVFALNLLLNPNMTKLRSVAIVYSQALPSSGFTGKGPTDTLLVTAIIGITVGSIMFIISILFIICLTCIKFRFYGLFFCIGPVLLILLFLILIGFALFIMITGDTELQRLASSTQTTVYYYYNSTSTTLVRDGWDFVQYYFSCCGVKSNQTDWYVAPATGWAYNSQLPRSCCGYDSNDIGHAGRIFVGTNVPTLTGFCYYGDIRQPTCYDSIKTNLLITVLVFLISTALIVLILAILSIVLLFMYRTVHHRVGNSMRK